MARKRSIRESENAGKLFSDENNEKDNSSADEAEELADKKQQTSDTETPTTTAVWLDEDDEHETVDLISVPRRKKLRKALEEKNISASEYSKRIREYMKEKGRTYLGATSGWAELPSERVRRAAEQSDDSEAEEEEEESDEEESEVFKPSFIQSRSTANILAKRRRIKGLVGQEPGKFSLRPGLLNYRNLPYANEEDPNKAEVRCVEFHPKGRVILTAGLDKALRLFVVDGEKSTKVQGVHLQNFPIHSAKFTGGGNEVVMTSRRKQIYSFDVNCGEVEVIRTLQRHPEKSWEKFAVSADGSKLGFLGQQGKLVLVSNTSKQEIGQLRHNNRVQSAAFAAEGGNEHHLYTATEEGTVYLWDVRKLACVDMHKDEGAIHNTCLAVSTSHYALGSDSGVVNVYPISELGSGSSVSIFGARTAKPRKSLFNLTTEISKLVFNSDGQMMAFASHMKKNAIRLTHVPSMTVFKNWPSNKTFVRRTCDLAFSPGCGYLAIGNDKGTVNLLRLTDYVAR